MGLPFIDEIPKSRTYLTEFRGYNHTDRCGDNEFYNCLNLTNDNYPLLSTRKKRRTTRIEGTISKTLYNCMAGNYVFSLKVFGTNEKKVGYFFYDISDPINSYRFDMLGDYDEKTNYNVVRMGAMFIVYPCRFVYNTATNEGSTFENTVVLKEGTLVNCCLEDGTELTEPLKVYYGDDVGANVGEYFLWKEKQFGVGSKTYQMTEEGKKEVTIYVKIKGGYLNSDVFSVKKDTTNIPWIINQLNEKNTIKGSDWFAVQGYLSGNSKIEFKGNECIAYKGDTINFIKKNLDGYIIEYYSNIPNFDYIIECKNRLWACKYDGKINKIYATKLGSYKDWFVYSTDADASYVVSVGTPGAFTGAMTIDENPVFFKENYIHKIYVSSTGAHQLYTLNCRGVQEGSSKSLIRVNESIIYKSKYDVVAFDGTSVTPISEPLGADYYTDAIAGAYDGKYVMWCKREGTPCMFVYDTKKRLWQQESAPDNVEYMDSSVEMLCIFDSGDCIYYQELDGRNANFETSYLDHIEITENKVPYMFESGIQGLASPDGKYLIRIDYRVSLGFGDTFNVFIEYDSDGKWHNVARLQGDQPIPKVRSLPIMPRRCDHFRIKVTGRGEMKLYSITKTYEKGAENGY